MKKKPRKVILSLLAVVFLFFGVLPVLFFGLAVPERIARKSLESQARRHGFTDFRLADIDIQPSGRFVLSNVVLGGRVRDASAYLDRLDVSVRNLRGRFEWLSVLALSKTPQPRVAGPVAAWLPRFLTALEVEGANVSCRMVGGEQYQAEEMSLKIRRPTSREADLAVSVEEILGGTESGELVAGKLSFTARCVDAQVIVERFAVDSGWGNLEFHGKVEDLYVLGRELARCRSIVREATGEQFVVALAAAVREFHGTGLHLEGKYQPGERIRLRLPDSVSALSFPKVVEFTIAETGQGLEVQGEAGEGAVEMREAYLSWGVFSYELADGTFRLGPAEVNVENIFGREAGVRRVELVGEGDLNLPSIPIEVSLRTLDGIPVDELVDSLADGEWRSGAMLMASGVTGTASVEVAVSATLFPFQLGPAAAELSVNLGIPVPPEAAQVPVIGAIQLGYENDFLEIRSRDLEVAKGSVGIEGGILFDGWEPVSMVGKLHADDFRIDETQPFAHLFPFDATGVLSAAGSVHAGTDWRVNIAGEATMSADFEDVAFGNRSTGPVNLAAETHWEYGRFTFDTLRVSLLGGAVEGTGVWDGPRSPLSGSLDVRVDFPSVGQLKRAVPEFTLPIDGPLRGRIAGGGTLGATPLGELRATLTSDSPTWKRTAAADELRLSVILSPDKLYVNEAGIWCGSSSVTVTGEIEVDRQLRGQVAARLGEDFWQRSASFLDQGAFSFREFQFAPGGEGKLDGEFSGSWSDPVGEMDLSIRGLEFRDVTLRDFHAHASYASRVVAIPRMHAVAVRSAGDGEIDSATSSLQGSVNVRLAREPSVDFDLGTDPFDLGILSGWQPALNDFSGQIAVSAKGRYHHGLESLDASLRAEEVSLSGRLIQDVSAEASLVEGSFRLGASAQDVTGGTVQGRLEGVRDGRWDLSLETAGIDLGSLPVLEHRVAGILTASVTAETRLEEWPWQAGVPTSRSVGRGIRGTAWGNIVSASVASVGLGDITIAATAESEAVMSLIRSASPAIQAKVVIPLKEGPLLVSGRWQDADLSSLAKRAGLLSDMVHSGSCELEWSAAGGVTGRVMSSRLNCALGERPIAQQEPCMLVIERDRVHIPRVAFVSSEVPDMVVVASGVVPLATSASILDLDLTLRDFELGVLSLDKYSIRDLSGVCRMEGRITGSLSDPSFAGDISVSKGRLRLSMMPQALSDVELDARVERARIELNRLEGRISRGTVGASGEIELVKDTGARMDLSIRFRGVRYSGIEYLVLAGDGDIRIHGVPDSATIDGRIMVSSGSYIRPLEWSHLLTGHFREKSVPTVWDPKWNPDLNIEIEIPGNFWVRNTFLAAELGARAKLVGNLRRPTLTGEAYAKRGIFQLKRGRFKIRKAVAIFDESRPFFPYFLVGGDTRLRGYIVRVQVNGDPEGVDFEWSSSPPLSEGQVVHLLLTGSVIRGEQETQDASAGWIVSQGLGSALSPSVSHVLPVDSVELWPVEKTDGVGTEIVAETTISDRLAVRQYVEIEDPSNPGLGADYRLTENLSLSGRAKRDGTYIVEFLYEILF